MEVLKVVTVVTVSIPFKRESVSKVKTLRTSVSMLKSFNSLQTGKRIQSQRSFSERR